MKKLIKKKILTIYATSSKDTIKLITSGFDSSKILLPYNTEKLIYFKENTNFYLPYDYKEKKSQNYLVNIKSIKGSQKLIKDEKNTDLKGNNYIEAVSYPYDKSFKIENIQNKNDDNDQAILITYDKVKADKLFNIEKDIENEISINGANSFPQYIYTPLTYKISMKVKYFFHDISYNNKNQDKDEFKITGVIIDKEKLNERIKNPETKIEGEKYEGIYSLQNKNGSIYIEQEKIKQDKEYYLFITVNKDTNNKNEYKTISIQYIAKEGEEEDKEDKKSESNFVDGKTILLIVCIYIALICILVPLIVFICVKVRKSTGVTFNYKDVNQSLGISHDESLVPKN